RLWGGAGVVVYVSWFATYLRETRGVMVWEWGVLSSRPRWGITAGCLAGGWLSDLALSRTRSLRLGRQGVAVASLLAATACIGLAYPVRDAWLAVTVLGVGAFAASIAGPAAYALTVDRGGSQTACYFGVMNPAGTIGAIAFPVIVPQLVKLTGSWDAVLALFAGLHVAAFACWLLFDADARTPSGTREPP